MDEFIRHVVGGGLFSLPGLRMFVWKEAFLSIYLMQFKDKWLLLLFFLLLFCFAEVLT